MPRREHDAGRGRASPTARSLIQAGGFVLAVAATLVVFLTEDTRLLRLAVVAVAWAFVLATVATGRGGADRAQAAREAELRRLHELELDREVAARRQYELELENELRRETEVAMRHELDAIRGAIASLAGLREEIARVSSLRGDIAALGGLRDEVARVAALREDVAGLAALRGDLGQLAALREDVGRLRAELAEQLSSEMLVERVVMRTQAGRLPGDRARAEGSARTLDGGAADWSDDHPPPELTGGWPAVRLDEPRPPQQFEQVRTTSWPVAPPTTTLAAASAAALPPSPLRSVSPAPVAAPPTVVPGHLPPGAAGATAAGQGQQPSYLSDDRYAAPTAERPAQDVPPAAPPTVASPVQLPSSTLSPSSALSPSSTPSPVDGVVPRRLPEEPRAEAVGDGVRRRRTDEPAARSLPPAHAPTVESSPEVPRRPAPEPAGGAVGPDTSDRLARILAENAVTPPPGGRRRRRYRQDGESDDVLARVLGRD